MSRPAESYGPHTDADRIDHCTSCGAENPPQPEDRCPACGEVGSLIATWGDFQHQRFYSGERYENNGPQPWEDGPQPAKPTA